VEVIKEQLAFLLIKKDFKNGSEKSILKKKEIKKKKKLNLHNSQLFYIKIKLNNII
jgi:hypothetical protein